MIELVDLAMEARVRRDLTYPPSGFRVTFQPSGRDGGDGEVAGAETVGIYLYDIREDLDRKQTGTVYQYVTPLGGGDEPRRKLAQHDPPRYARLSYLVSALAPDALIAHRMLGELLVGFARSREFEVQLPPELEQMHLQALLDVGHPPAEDRALTELWSTVGHTLAPALNVTVTVPLLSYLPAGYDHWVSQPLVIGDENVEFLRPGTPRRATDPTDPTSPTGEGGGR
ncbi:Pvc16 family protein [Streptomyces roseifaciens]|uniref:Pvc16 family protein n=1 Tax=Streptomyces roseifaciens TaxID=1488406 RepID=UPI00071807C8|nr:Pvc16 family protein [Streptomyces roseifaciens]